ncbi:MAG TPA: hypothetical protein VM143_02380 [Acidimicrobiales bacterium]|nr:hypothetical protein [Acidimicrobiales bacterium]
MTPIVMFLVAQAVASGLRSALVSLTAIRVFGVCAYLIVIELSVGGR